MITLYLTQLIHIWPISDQKGCKKRYKPSHGILSHLEFCEKSSLASFNLIHATSPKMMNMQLINLVSLIEHLTKTNENHTSKKTEQTTH